MLRTTTCPPLPGSRLGAVRLQDDSAPSINVVGGGIWTDGWKSGNQPIAIDASDNSGIRVTAVSVDGKQRLRLDRNCDASQVVPCPNATAIDAYDPIPTAAYTDGPHQVTVQASDAAGNTSSAARIVYMDNSPRGPPQGLAVEGGEGWQAREHFNLRWLNPAASGAPTAGVIWQVCQDGAPGSCVAGSKDGDKVEALSALPVPRDRDWTMKLWLRDAAGNNTANNGVAVHLRSDTEAPSVVSRRSTRLTSRA